MHPERQNNNNIEIINVHNIHTYIHVYNPHLLPQPRGWNTPRGWESGGWLYLYYRSIGDRGRSEEGRELGAWRNVQLED
jgi:hypothetical protein